MSEKPNLSRAQADLIAARYQDKEQADKFLEGFNVAAEDPQDDAPSDDDEEAEKPEPVAVKSAKRDKPRKPLKGLKLWKTEDGT